MLRRSARRLVVRVCGSCRSRVWSSRRCSLCTACVKGRSHAEPGALGAALPVQARAAANVAVARRLGARATAGAPADRAFRGGGSAAAERDGGRRTADGESALRRGAAPGGMPEAAREGHRLRVPPGHRARRQGRARPLDHAAGEPGPAGASRQGAAAAPARSQGGLRRGLAAARAGAEISARALRMGVAVRVSLGKPLAGPGKRRGAPAPSAPGYARQRGQACRCRCRHRKAGELPHAAPLLRHAPCWSAATTSARCRSCSGIPTCPRRWCTRT